MLGSRDSLTKKSCDYYRALCGEKDVENETEKVQAFAEKVGIPIVGEIPRSDEIIRWEDQGKTVIEGDSESEISRRFFDLAEMLLKAEEEE